MTEYKCDLAIVGGGPAGLAAATYGARARLNTVLIEAGSLGGTVSKIDIVENYPGFPEGISGLELVEKMTAQCRRFGVTEVNSEVSEIVPENGGYRLLCGANIVQARTLIIASGSSHRCLDVPGEEHYLGKGVSYCATCDGAFFRNKAIAVVGGGDSAVKEALYLTRFASKVTIIHRRHELRAEKIIQEQAFNNEKIDFIWDSAVKEISGRRLVENIRLANVLSGEERDLAVNGVFIFVGMVPRTAMVRNLLALDEGGQIITDAALSCGRPGIWAAGDVRQGSPRQIATAVGDGCQAALAAIEYLQKA